MKQLLRTYVDKLPYIRDLREEVNREGRYRAGHYYSPIPAEDEVVAHLTSREPFPTDLPDVDLQAEAQLALLAHYAAFYGDISFPREQNADFRYYYPNYLFDYSDAFFLYSYLRHHQPKHLIEIGSGFSSSVILDTLDRMPSYRPDITFIEPNPSRLERLLRPKDSSNVRIIVRKVQEVDLSVFDVLEEGDLLFVDSSHIVKCGSDVPRLFFDIMPILPDGITVHFHDVFWPFDYPTSWLNKGFYYNEAYCLRAFLAYNSLWKVYFFSSFLDFRFGDVIREQMPLCADSPGSSLYLRKGAD